MSRARYFDPEIDFEDCLWVCPYCGAEIHADCVGEECPMCGEVIEDDFCLDEEDVK